MKRRLLQPLWVLLAIIFLIEAWFWDHLAPVVARVVALIPLLLFGPESLFGMVAAITLGIFVGIYSSVYMAAPLLIWLGVTSDSFVHKESATDRQERVARGEA